MSSQARAGSGSPNMEALNKGIVTVYKFVGFAILTIVVGGLVAYIGLNAFYFVYRSWAAPAIVSPSDPRVLELSARLAQESALREKLAVERGLIEGRLRAADLTITAHTHNLENLELALGSEAAQRQRALGRLRGFASELRQAGRNYESSSAALGSVSRQKLSDQYAAKLIDQHDFVAGNYQIAQMATTDISIKERAAALDTELERLSTELASLERSTRAKKSQATLTYEAAKIYADINASELAIRTAQSERDALLAAKTALGRALEQYDGLLKTIEGAALLRAVRNKLTIAFLPYENLEAAEPGAPVYGCRVGPLFCHQVGQVVGRLEGEVTSRHPLFKHDLRGQMVELQFAEPEWAEDTVLYLGHAPFRI